MSNKQLIEKWRKYIRVIERHITEMIADHTVFKKMLEIVRANPIDLLPQT